MEPANREAGLTLLEVLVVVAILGLALGIASVNLRPLGTPLQAGTALLEGYFRQARVRAIASTSACRAVPEGLTRVVTQCATSCSDTGWTTESTLQLTLPEHVAFETANWSVCFSSRGIATQNVTIALEHGNGSAKVEVLLGGTTRVVP